MPGSQQSLNIIGAAVANVNNIILFLLFIARINRLPQVEYWLGIIFLLSFFPVLFLFVSAFSGSRALLYFIQLGLMIVFIIVELLLDYILKIDFRQNQSIVIPYVTLFFAAAGGMIGVASHAGKFWTILTVVTFLIMSASSIYMHISTGK